MKKTDKDSRGVSNAQKLRVLRRDGYTCVYCGTPGSDANLEIDHRIPYSKGGGNHLSNLFTACQPCNHKKGAEIWTLRKGYQPNEFGPRRRSETMRSSPLDGVFVHVLKHPNANPNVEDINRQGQVLGIFENQYIAVQLLSFFDGRPTKVELFPIEYATNNQMIFYYDDIEMSFACEKMMRGGDLSRPEFDQHHGISQPGSVKVRETVKK